MIIINVNCIIFRDKNNDYHRINGVALINDEYQAWYQHGLFHRLDGPAFINVEYQAWWVEGKRHRLDGPAIIDNNYVAWYIEDVEYTEYVYHEKLKEMGLR